MNVDTIKDLMNKRLITEVVDASELAKLSDDEIRANYITQVVDLPEFSNDDVEVPTETPTETPTDTPTEASTEDPTDEPTEDENGDAPVVDEGEDNIETPEEVEGGDF
jgi:hypothetical protein